MALNGVRPIDQSTWLASVLSLKDELTSGRCEIDAALRLAFHLAKLAPLSFLGLVDAQADERELDTLIEAQAFELAAIALLGDDLSFAVGVDRVCGRSSARVWTKDLCVEARIEGAGSVPPLLQAWLDFLVQAGTRASS